MGHSGSTLKTAFLLAAITALFILAGRLLGGTTGMVFALAMALAMNLGAYWFSDRLALAMSGAKEVSREAAPDLHALVDRLALQARMPKPRVYVIDNQTPNAFATGRSPAHAAVAVTSGLQRTLGRDELSGVLAHELAHIRNRDTLIAAVVASIAGAITLMANLAHWALLFGGLGQGDDGEDDGGALPSLAGTIVLAIVAPIAATLIQLAISRAREFRADAAGASILGDPMPLARALQKLETANRTAPMAVNPATAHQFTVQPLAGGGLMSLFRTHPPMPARVERLQRMALRPLGLPIRS